MIPANRRLTTEFFNETIAGRSFHLPELSIKVIQQKKNDGVGGKAAKKSRFAATASKKNFKTAVSRNNARRRTYSALAPLLPHVTDGFYVIILIKSETMKLKSPELRNALETIFEKAGIMKKTLNKVK